MSDIVIKVESLSKLYRIGGPEQVYQTLREAIVGILSSRLRLLRRRSPLASAQGAAVVRQLPQSIWALKEVSFEVERGEIVGIIGHNGAGKSTLLKILSLITEPSEGRAEIRGRVGSLLEIGTGFHPELTGRENIYLNGAILGMRKAEIDRKFDDIVAFAEVEKFIDTPVKRYSSGMYVRLAFAVAAHLEPEVLLVDEVLAVGDAAFHKKCLGKMDDVAKEGRTILFVSHNMSAINRLCKRTLWIDEGCLRLDGPSEQVVSGYLTSGVSNGGQKVWEDGIANSGVDEFKIRGICIKNSSGEITDMLNAQEPFWVEIEYEILSNLPSCRIGVRISTVDGITVFAAYDADQEEYAGLRQPGCFISKCKVPGYLLSPGRYILSGVAGIRGIKNLVLLENILSFDMEDTGATSFFQSGKHRGIVRPKLEWQREAL